MDEAYQRDPALSLPIYTANGTYFDGEKLSYTNQHLGMGSLQREQKESVIDPTVAGFFRGNAIEAIENYPNAEAIEAELAILESRRQAKKSAYSFTDQNREDLLKKIQEAGRGASKPFDTVALEALRVGAPFLPPLLIRP